MSHLALRRVMIRLFHDAAFVAALHADPASALAGLDLTATEIGWLTAQPPAAWRADSLRPARVRAALAEEFPATVELATEHAAGFLRSPEFHLAIQDRGSLALAFGDYLTRAPDPRARALARLERAVAAVRRAPEACMASPAGRLRLAARALIVTVPDGALELLDAVRAGGAAGGLGPDDSAVLVSGVADGGAVTLEALEPALAGLLGRAVEGCARDELMRAARLHGALPGEDEVIVAGLVEDGLLR